jgi:N-acetylglucosamine-6-phosphate deacetylase
MLIRNAQLFIGNRFQNGSVRLRGGSIAETGENLRAEKGETDINLQGDYLLPGFVDVHIHAYGGRDTMEGEAAVRAMSRELRKLGVAAFCPTTMSAGVEETRKAVAGIRSVMERPEPEGARVLGAHMEAPFLQESRAGAQRKEFFRDPSMEALEELTGGDIGAVRLITLAPERKGSREFICRAAAAGIHVSIGHTAATAEQTHQAADWGADHVTHTFNAQTPLLHREPGVPGAALTDDRLYCEMICDGIHLHQDTVRLLAKCKGLERAVAITDAMEAAGLPDGEYALGGQKVFVKDGAARLADGTLAGSVLTMPQALENLIHRFGIRPEDACAMCTCTPADSIGEKLAGRITAGAPAVLTRWSPDWHMAGVIAGDAE